MRLLSPLFTLAAVATLAKGIVHINEYRRRRSTDWSSVGPAGSTTNANDAVDDIELSPDATPDQVLDAGVEHTFPASDPVAVQDAYETAYEKEQREKRARPGAR